MLRQLFCKHASALLALSFVAMPTVLYSNDSAESEAEKPKVEKTELKGVFEAVRSETVAADSKQITSWTIERIVPHGTTIRKGQNVVWFETKDLDKRIKDAKVALSLSEIALKDAEFEYKKFLETQRIERQATKRALDEANQDYDNFVRVDRDRQVLSAEFNLKSAQASLENVQEELEQLTQMYEADDLTEESEEIVLKRAKQAVEAAQFRLDGTEIATQRTLDQTLPRMDAAQEKSLHLAEISHDRAIRGYDSTEKKRSIELDKQREQFGKEKTDLQELQAERRASVLKAPIDGVVLHGELTRGKLGDKPSSLEPTSKVTQNQVIATIVDPAKLRIRVDLEEKYLHLVRQGTTCTVTVPSYPEFEASGKVKSVSKVAYANGKYDCVIEFQQKEEHPEITPTMACVVTL